MRKPTVPACKKELRISGWKCRGRTKVMEAKARGVQGVFQDMCIVEGEVIIGKILYWGSTWI